MGRDGVKILTDAILCSVFLQASIWMPDQSSTCDLVEKTPRLALGKLGILSTTCRFFFFFFFLVFPLSRVVERVY